MNQIEKRKIVSLNFFANALFALFALLLSSSFFMFLGVVSKNVHRLVISDSPYYLLVLGSTFLLIGLLLLLFKRLSSDRQVSYRTFLYAPLSCMLLILVLSVVSALMPKLMLLSLFMVTLVWAYCVLIFIQAWRRSGGLVPAFLCSMGAGIAGIYSSFYGIQAIDAVYFIKGAMLTYLVLLLLYELGLLGFMTAKRYSAVLPAIIAVLFILIPVRTERINEISLIKGYEHLSSHITGSRKVEVQISTQDPREHILFLENGRRTFSYPLSYDQELSLCYAMLQNKNSGNILVAGDAPLGFFSVIKKMPRVGVVHYLPSDPAYSKAWDNYASADVLNTFVVIPSKNKLMDRYGMIVFFPPTVRGYGTKAGLNRSIFRLLAGKLSSAGTFVVILSRELSATELPSNLEDRLQSILYHIYGSVYTSQLNGFKFLLASKDPSNISSDLSVLKYRFLSLGVEYEYGKAKDFFETAETKLNNSVPKGLKPKYTQTAIITVLMALLILGMYFIKKDWKQLDTFIFTSLIGTGFGLSMLINQMFSVDSYSVFISSLGLLISSSALGILLSSWKRLELIGRKWHLALAYSFGACVLLLSIMMGWAFIYTLAIGASFGLVVTFYSWERSECKMSIASILKIISFYFAGVGTGIIALFLFAQFYFSLTEISFITASIFIMLIIYNLMMLRRAV